MDMKRALPKHALPIAAAMAASDAMGTALANALGGSMPTSSIELVGPSLAATWLEQYNTHNRTVSQRRVDEYAREMHEGRWRFNGESIQFDRDGVLLNGQHRLWAIVASGCSQMFSIVRGLDAPVQLTIDQGTRRSPAEQLGMAGLTANNSVAAAIRVYIRWTTNRFFGDQIAKKVTTTEVVEWAQNHPDAYDLMLSFEGKRFYRNISCTPAVTLAALFMFASIDGDSADGFFASLSSGAGLSAGSPILTLRNRLQDDRARGIRPSDRDMVALFVTAWNAYRDGRQLSKLQRPAGGLWTRDKFPVAH